MDKIIKSERSEGCVILFQTKKESRFCSSKNTLSASLLSSLHSRCRIQKQKLLIQSGVDSCYFSSSLFCTLSLEGSSLSTSGSALSSFYCQVQSCSCQGYLILHVYGQPILTYFCFVI